MAEFIFNKIPCFQHIFQNTFRQMRLKNENFTNLVLQIIQTTLTLQKASLQKLKVKAENAKNESCKPYLENREQK